jgi:hypothetical protein
MQLSCERATTANRTLLRWRRTVCFGTRINQSSSDELMQDAENQSLIEASTG